MRTYLIPTDFSSSSVAAAHYAASLSTQTGVTRLILLHAYYISTFESVLPNTEFVQLLPHDIDETFRLKKIEMEDIRQELLPLVDAATEIEIRISRLPLLRAILEVQEETPVDLLVLCSKNNYKDDTQVGRNIIEISKISPAPVLVVPVRAVAQPLQKIVLACDFKNTTQVNLLKQIEKVWNNLQVELLVVDINTTILNRQKEAKTQAGKTALAETLASYQPQYFYIKHPDAAQGIVDFATENQAQMIISLPRKRRFFRSIWNRRFSNRLTLKSTVPVLLLKQD
ncbi:MAG: universal stress protein [Sphingobacteriaceae bacterium]|nr:MAG: universal stress protein [Sphingobacteriaceae bacterium]